MRFRGTKGRWARLRAIADFFLLALLLPAVALHGFQDNQNKTVNQNNTKATTVGSSARKIDACSLLTGAEIQAVQGEAPQESKPSEQPSRTFLMAQCFFLTTTAAKSISLAVALPDPAKPSAQSPRQYWKKQFLTVESANEKEEAPAGKTKSSKEPEHEDEKESSKPRLIDGLGEEAYWVGSSISGALYVLKGDVFLRISVGGVREESSRIEKSKALARAALKRL